MKLHSTFESDLERERCLTIFLDAIYTKRLKYYSFERITNVSKQQRGTDLEFKHLTRGSIFRIDEKAQLDYLNENLPTFAFELAYLKDGKRKKGWLFDTTKQTDFYALITAIYSDEPKKFTSCNVTFVNRYKLISFLTSKNLNETVLNAYVKNNHTVHGKVVVKELHSKDEGYLFFSTKNKAEQPVNLILKLDFLEENGLAKRL